MTDSELTADLHDRARRVRNEMGGVDKVAKMSTMIDLALATKWLTPAAAAALVGRLGFAALAIAATSNKALELGVGLGSGLGLAIAAISNKASGH